MRKKEKGEEERRKKVDRKRDGGNEGVVMK